MDGGNSELTMTHFMNFPMCTSGSGQYVNNTLPMMNNIDTTAVSNINFSETQTMHPSMRKRQLSDQMTNYVHVEDTHKKLKYDDNQVPSRVEAMILQLSTQFTNMSDRFDKRISDLETNFEDRVSEKLSDKLSTMIDNKIGAKISEVKTEMKGELVEMKTKITKLEEKLQSSDGKAQSDNLKNRFVIKNLDFDEREKTEPTLTVNKVQGMLKDCLGLANVSLKSVVRKESKGRYPGVIVAETKCFEGKQDIMKNKSKLKHSRNFSRVYIENDIPVETRNFQNTVRTVLKEIGKDKNFKFAGNRLLPRHT